MAEALDRYVDDNNLSPSDHAKIGDDGKAKISGLSLGLYLVKQTKACPGYKLAKPFLVTVPRKVDGKYVYEVEAYDKPELVPTTTPTGTGTPTPTPGRRLPQTGQLWWPVWLLCAAAVVLVLSGALVKKKNK